jgi:hypothetical protein
LRTGPALHLGLWAIPIARQPSIRTRGLPLWTNRYDGPENINNYATAIALDHSGNVIVAGLSAGSRSGYDFATVKYICVSSPMVTGFQLTNGTFRMRVDDVLQPGTLVIAAIRNLAGWAPVFTNTTPTNVLFSPAQRQVQVGARKTKSVKQRFRRAVAPLKRFGICNGA